MQYNEKVPSNNNRKKPIPFDEIGPKGLRDDKQYIAWKDFILTKIIGYKIRFSKYLNKYIRSSPIEQPQHYDFHMTVAFNHPQFDHNVIKYTSLLIRRINKYCSRGNYAVTGRYIQGFAFVEHHFKSRKMEGCMHLHIMGYFPDTFYKKPTLDELKAIAKRASDKLNATAKKPKIKMVIKAKKSLDIAKNKLKNASDNLSTSDKNILEGAVKKAMKKLTETEHEIENLIFADSGVQVDEAYGPNELLDYVSKHLRRHILDERIMMLGPNGLHGYIPSSTRINRNAGELWNESSETDGTDSQGSLRQSSEPIH